MILILLYLSGNFPQLAKPEKELAMANSVTSMGYDYHRLLTFYYKKHCETILNTQKTITMQEKYGKDLLDAINSIPVSKEIADRVPVLLSKGSYLFK